MRPTDEPSTTIDCTHKADHYHGTLVAYKMDACRCVECKASARRYGRWQRGTGRKVDLSRSVTPDHWFPGSESWLADMRAGLMSAVQESRRRESAPNLSQGR